MQLAPWLLVASHAFPQAPQLLMVASEVSHPSESGAVLSQSAQPGAQPVYTHAGAAASVEATHDAPKLCVVSQTTSQAPQLVTEVFELSQPSAF